MTDERIIKLAKLVVEHSVFVRKGENVMISSGTEAVPLVREVYKQVLLKGAFPFVNLGFQGASYIYFKHATDAQLKAFPSVTFATIKKMDKYIGIGADYNTRELSNIDPKKIALRGKAARKIGDYVANGKPKIHRCSMDFPTNALAQDAEMSLEEYEDFLYGACLQDWNKLLARMKKVQNAMNNAKEIHIIGSDTDLRIKPFRKSFIVDDGKENMPGGEVFGAPEKFEVEGHIRFTYPAIRSGVEVQNIFAEFKKGKCIKATAEKNEKFLNTMLDTDKGSRYIGELGIGMNPKVTKFTKNLLFDEKICNTIHLAFGMAYKECGEPNKSALHWDIVKDLSRGGRIYTDKKLVFKNKWLV
ncbi:MAG: aminopeptidase [Candidatus Aenigmarchaeota archaeon]|nr:aminopeptidase [Candidatus Aenigmarchaeota archaeon]